MPEYFIEVVAVDEDSGSERRRRVAFPLTDDQVAELPSAVELTTDQQAAINGAASPSAGNVFATMADVGGVSVQDAADEAARLALTGLPRGARVYQVDTGFWYEVVNPADLSVAGNWKGLPKVYNVVLNQTDTDDPVPTVLENDIGSIVWTRSNAGAYAGTLAGAFPDGKTFIPNSKVWQRQYLDGDGTNVFQVYQATSDLITINQVAGLDDDSPVDWLTAVPIEILVYP